MGLLHPPSRASRHRCEAQSLRLNLPLPFPFRPLHLPGAGSATHPPTPGNDWHADDKAVRDSLLRYDNGMGCCCVASGGGGGICMCRSPHLRTGLVVGLVSYHYTPVTYMAGMAGRKTSTYVLATLDP